MGEIFWFTVAEAFAVQTPQKHLALCHHRGQLPSSSFAEMETSWRIPEVWQSSPNEPCWFVERHMHPSDSENFSSSQMLNDPFMDFWILTLPLHLRNQTIGVFATVHFMTIDTQLASWWRGRLPPAVLGYQTCSWSPWWGCAQDTCNAGNQLKVWIGLGYKYAMCIIHLCVCGVCQSFSAVHVNTKDGFVCGL